MSDIRFALRTLFKHRGPTLVIVLTLAVGIAATSLIYSVIDVVEHPIPAVTRDRLVYVTSTDTRIVQAGAEGGSMVLRSPASMPDSAAWTTRSKSFDALAGFSMGSSNLTGVQVPMRVSTIRVTANLVDLWGLVPSLGRGFQPVDGRIGAEPVTMLSYVFWQRQFASKGDVLGQRILLDGVSHTIVGVLPPDAGTGVFKSADVFIVLTLDPLRGARDDRTVLVTGRLKSGVTRDQASSELDAIARQLQTEHPATNQRVGAAVLPIVEASGFNVRVLLGLLGLIAVLILVVACANVANVVAAQNMTRRHEFAVRAALGARRVDRVRQLMTESMLLSSAAAIVGLSLAVWGIGLLRWLAGDAFGFADLRMNERVLMIGLLAAIIAPLGFALVPAIRMAPDAQELKDGARSVGTSVRGRRLRGAVMALQACAAMILMVQIGLLVRTTWKLDHIPQGFDPSRVLTFRVGLSGARYSQPQAIDRFAVDLLARLRALPGIASAGLIDTLPVADDEPTARITIEGKTATPLEKRPQLTRTAIAGEYLSTMRIPLIRGREFSNAELADASPVALISDDAARRYWTGRDPIGTRIALDAVTGEETWLEIVGVVGNIRNSDIDQGSVSQVYLPMSRRPSRNLAVVVKSMGADPLPLVPAIRTQVAQIDPNQPIHDVATMSRVLYDDLAGTYLLTGLLGTIALVALSLSAAGIYGVVTSAVAQRRREIGVRLALGAQPGSIVRMVVAYGARPVALGSLVGLVAAVGLAWLISSSIPEFDARDPLNYLGVTATIALVTFVASYLPARRAAATDPVVALRQE